MNKKGSMTSALTFLQQYDNQREKFADHMVTGDKTGNSYSHFATKNNQWCTSILDHQNQRNSNKVFMTES
jgi:hypothetical protein